MEIDDQITAIEIDMDFCKKMREKQNSFYQNETLCDVILIAGEKR